MERACSIIAEACMPIFDKESASDECNMERNEAWKTLCTHYLETLDAAPKPPSPMTAEWREARAQHTDRISRIRKQHPQVLEIPSISSQEERDDFVAAMRALSDVISHNDVVEVHNDDSTMAADANSPSSVLTHSTEPSIGSFGGHRGRFYRHFFARPASVHANTASTCAAVYPRLSSLQQPTGLPIRKSGHLRPSPLRQSYVAPLIDDELEAILLTSQFQPPAASGTSTPSSSGAKRAL